MLVGDPRGGRIVWTKDTRTYSSGEPRGPGHYVLGIAGAPYYCIAVKAPQIICAGNVAITIGTSYQSASTSTNEL